MLYCVEGYLVPLPDDLHGECQVTRILDEVEITWMTQQFNTK